jgi:hypothetical protein
VIKLKMFLNIFVLFTLLSGQTVHGEIDAREKVIEFLRSADMGDRLDAPVRISVDKTGVVCISDEGHFITQYVLMQPELSADVEVIKEPDFEIPPSRTKAVIVTHGWIDKGSDSWPADMAVAISQRVDPNEWVGGFFDWSGGAAVVSPVDAAKYARDVAGARLAKAILELGAEFKHIHLIGHSAGCWAINEAAKKIADQTGAVIHLTFLDAYVPPFWDQSELGAIEAAGWVEHYYTKDFTLAATHIDLSGAHNVDITDIDGLVKDHKFPYRWYYATAAGRYRPTDREKGQKVVTRSDDIDYGFERSREAGRRNWQKSIALKRGQKAVLVRKDGKIQRQAWQILFGGASPTLRYGL